MGFLGRLPLLGELTLDLDQRNLVAEPGLLEVGVACSCRCYQHVPDVVIILLTVRFVDFPVGRHRTTHRSHGHCARPSAGVPRPAHYELRRRGEGRFGRRLAANGRLRGVGSRRRCHEHTAVPLSVYVWN